MKLIKCKNVITEYKVKARRPRQYDDNVSSRNVRDFFLKRNENEVEKFSLIKPVYLRGLSVFSSCKLFLLGRLQRFTIL